MSLDSTYRSSVSTLTPAWYSSTYINIILYKTHAFTSELNIAWRGGGEFGTTVYLILVQTLTKRALQFIANVILSKALKYTDSLKGNHNIRAQRF